MKFLYAIALCFIASNAYCGEPGPCTPSEQVASKAYWNSDGAPKYQTLTAPPKHCMEEKLKFDYSCPVAGGPAAIQLFRESGGTILTAASLSEDVYTIGNRLQWEEPNLHPARAVYLYDDGKNVTRFAERLEIPPVGTTTTYLKRGTEMPFSVTNRRNSETGKINIVIAYRGTPDDMDAWTGTNLPQEVLDLDAPMYSQAVVVATDVIAGMQRAFGFKKYCDIPIVYTGHSLGGALALHAALRTIKGNCVRKNDAVVVFNPALSTYDKLTAGEQQRKTLGIVAIFQAKGDFIKRAHEIAKGISEVSLLLNPQDASDILRAISKDAQVVLFNNVDAEDLVDVGDASSHSIKRMRLFLAAAHDLAPNTNDPLPPATVARLCRWYKPVPNLRP